MKEVLLEPADHRLGVIRTAGDVVHEVGDAIAWVVVESGEGHLTVDGQSADVGGRAGVFEVAWRSLVRKTRRHPAIVPQIVRSKTKFRFIENDPILIINASK